MMVMLAEFQDLQVLLTVMMADHLAYLEDQQEEAALALTIDLQKHKALDLQERKPKADLREQKKADLQEQKDLNQLIHHLQEAMLLLVLVAVAGLLALQKEVLLDQPDLDNIIKTFIKPDENTSSG